MNFQQDTMDTQSSPTAVQETIRYYIRVKYYYYAGTFNRPESGPLRDDSGEVLTWASKDEAVRWLSEYRLSIGYGPMPMRRISGGAYIQDATYVLHHGEHSAPEYFVHKRSTRSMK